MNVERIIKQRQLELLVKASDNPSATTSDCIKESIDKNKINIIKKLREKLAEIYNIQEINTKEKFNFIRNAAWSILVNNEENLIDKLYLDSYDKAEILDMLLQSIFGYGILEPLILSPEVTEVMVNSLEMIFIEKDGRIERAKNKRGDFLKFNSPEELKYIIEKIVSPINRKIDESNPIVDARLPNGFRVNIALNPISLDGDVLTIRKFPENPYSMEDLISFDMITQEGAAFLKKLVEARYNIIISGGTGSGKTTFINALSYFINRNERIITIEDSAELKITNIYNLIRLESRPPNIEGRGEITIRDLLKSALRMRPDRIIVGEVRGGEALDMLQAMNTGHDGSLSTAHANSAEDVLSRLETMVLMSNVELNLTSIRQQIASAINIVVHLGKISDGTRKVIQIAEILGVKDNEYQIQDLFIYNIKQNDGLGGGLIKTKNRMKRTLKFKFFGVDPII